VSGRRVGATGPRRLALARALLLAWLGLAGPAPAQTAGPQDMASMMQGMLAMMKLWNAFNSMSSTDFGGSFSPSTAVDPWLLSDPWSSAAGLPGMSPWSAPGVGGYSPWSMAGRPPWSMPGPGGRPPLGMMPPPGIPGGIPGLPAGRAGSSATPLEGAWQGTNGEVLQFRGDRFRLVAPGQGEVKGTCMVYGDRLVAYVPDADTARLYRYELRGSLLALADEEGQVLLFRRAR
jgi:hypothetical protein